MYMSVFSPPMIWMSPDIDKSEKGLGALNTSFGLINREKALDDDL